MKFVFWLDAFFGYSVVGTLEDEFNSVRKKKVRFR
jgi:hypothetical protein